MLNMSATEPLVSAIAVIGSAGSLHALQEILAALPGDFPVPIIYLHRFIAAGQDVALPSLLQARTELPVRWLYDGEMLASSGVYILPPAASLAGINGFIGVSSRRGLSSGCHERSLEAVATASRGKGAVVVLSGGANIPLEGIQAVRSRGGTVLIQDESSALIWRMAGSVVKAECFDLMLRPAEIAAALVNLCSRGRAYTLDIGRKMRANDPQPPNNLHFEKTLAHFLAIAIRSQNAQMGNIQLLDRDENCLRIRAQRGFGLDFLEHFDTVRPLDDSACGRAMRERRPVVVNDLADDVRFAALREFAAAARFRAVQSAPILSREQGLLGVLSTHHREPQRFTPQAIHQLVEHARSAALIIQKT